MNKLAKLLAVAAAGFAGWEFALYSKYGESHFLVNAAGQQPGGLKQFLV